VTDGSGLNFQDNISFVYGDKIYVGLGISASGSYMNSFKIFYTTTNTWSDGPVIPAGMSIRRQAICFVIDNKAYIGMGRTATSSLKDWWRFDPSDNSWTPLTNYPVAGYSGACFVVNGTAYVMGAPSIDNGNIYQFDPAANSGLGSWKLRKNQVLPATSTTSFSIGENGYIVGGDIDSKMVNDVNRYIPSSNTFYIHGQGSTPALNDVPRLVLNNEGYLFYTAATNSIYLLDPATNKLIDLQTPLPDVFTGQYNSAVVNGRGYIWTSSGKVYRYLP
jgi:N-acetylneuraminic acid mutarotase